MCGFASSGIALLLAPSHFHFRKIFAFYLSFIGVIKKLFKKGSLKKVHIKDIADCMEVGEEYDKHKDKEDFSLIATFLRQ